VTCLLIGLYRRAAVQRRLIVGDQPPEQSAWHPSNVVAGGCLPISHEHGHSLAR
jgi:hypothetical protein